ncbi:MAG: DNA-binding response regulator [Bacteroidia bacterium]|nr:MAG: DNA-binding response regulator [Bacteroidia bacterium]
MQILIADDHPLFRKGLAFMLESAFDHLQLIECENGLQALNAIKKNQPQIAILDINMPEKNGLEVCKELKQENISTSIIILTMYKEEEVLKKALLYGAKGYIVKDNSANEIEKCISKVLNGEVYIGTGINTGTQQIDKELQKLKETLQSLTQVELKTLKLVSKHLSSKEIAELLFVSVKSVENYRSRICKKLGLDARNNSLLHWVLENKELLDSIKEL